MTKFVDDASIDPALDVTATCIILRLCSGDPVDRAAAITATLASATMTAGSGSGSYLLADGDVSGRKLRVFQQADMAIAANGTAATLVLDDGATMRLKTDLTATIVLSTPGTVTSNEFDREIADAA